MVLQNDENRVNDTRESKKLKNSNQSASDSTTLANVSKGAILTDSSNVVPRNGKVVSAERRLYAKGTSSSRKVVLYKDCSYGTFVDIFGEVIKVYKSKFDNEFFDLYITDYTENEKGYDYVSGENDWTGPLGQIILKICVAKPFPDFNKLTRGRLIKITNLRIYVEQEMMKGGTWIDKKYPQRQSISFFESKTSMPGYAEFKQRRDTYWEEHRAKYAIWLTSQGLPVPPELQPLIVEAAKPIVTCNFLAQQIYAIASLNAQKAMKDDSLVDKVFHLRGRVQGWYPQTFNDWVKAKCTTCNTEIPDGCVACLNHSGEIDIYFEFVLQIIDTSGLGGGEPASLQVNVSKKDYARFLPGITPTIEMRAPDNSYVHSLYKRIIRLLNDYEEESAAPFDFAVTLGVNGKGKKVWTFIGTRLNASN